MPNLHPAPRRLQVRHPRGLPWTGWLLLGLSEILIGSVVGVTTPQPVVAPEPVTTVRLQDCAPRGDAYTLLAWRHGWLDGKPREPAELVIQTGRYVAVLDPWRATLLRLGPLPTRPSSARSRTSRREASNPVPGATPALPVRFSTLEPVTRHDYATAGSLEPSDFDALLAVPPARLELTISDGTRVYRVVRAASRRGDWMNFPVRIIESGRWVQHFDIQQVEFEAPDGVRLDAEAVLDVVAWPEALHLRLEVRTPEAGPPLELGLALDAERVSSATTGARQSSRLEAGHRVWSATLRLSPGSTADADESSSLDASEVGVQAVDTRDESPCRVSWEPTAGWHRVRLTPRAWSVEQEPDRLERIRLSLTNATPREQVARLIFDDPSGTPAITGLTPMLRDAEGFPSGIPVQCSKNWHRQKDRRFTHEGPWFHGFTVLRLPPRSRVDAELALTFARWGGVPAASHAQLSLIGWGWNQVWDQAAIGSWGESICYEPDAIQQRCRIDDVRPLMVWGMGGSKRKWTWTHNVGGGDFLVSFDPAGRYQPWTRVRAAYLSQGPNLTAVRYTGAAAEGAIACEVEVRTPRTDDIHRAHHRLRYVVLEPVRFSRLAFYQVGADRYHWHQYGRLARGNRDGLLEEWAPGRGGGRYLRKGIPVEGDAAWFSMHEGVAADHLQPVEGAWATRGLIVRSWKARLGGNPAPPVAAVFGTEAGRIPSANLELVPPEGVTELRPGDFVEAELEWVILPHRPGDYYGPNAALAASLATDADTWRGVHRQAVGNDLRLKAVRGRLVHRYPTVVEVDSRQRAELRVTGGLGWVPVTFTGLRSPREWVLESDDGTGFRKVDQSVHGRDFWQAAHDPETGTWSLTFNLPMDSPDDRARARVIRLSRDAPRSGR